MNADVANTILDCSNVNKKKKKETLYTVSDTYRFIV